MAELSSFAAENIATRSREEVPPFQMEVGWGCLMVLAAVVAEVAVQCEHIEADLGMIFAFALGTRGKGQTASCPSVAFGPIHERA